MDTRIATHADPDVPAANLIGQSLPGGWRVVERLAGGEEDANFSFGYVVERAPGERAFLKALNFVAMLRPSRGDSRPVADRMGACLDAYRYERDLLCQCRDRRMSRVVKVIDHGEVTVPHAGPLGAVPYLILELAEGDVRRHLDLMRDLDAAWALRALKHTATGLRQLHAAGATHQDLRPANVLTQEEGREMKLGDLGKAVTADRRAPHQDDAVPGNRQFAPPEQLYGSFGGEWEMRRAADLYQLGSLAAYLFTRHSMTALIHTYMEPHLRWGRWNDGYGEALPYVRAGFARAMDEIEAAVHANLRHPELAARLVRIIRELCDPDPRRRGHTRDRTSRGSCFRLERYEGELNLLARRAEQALLGRR